MKKIIFLLGILYTPVLYGQFSVYTKISLNKGGSISVVITNKSNDGILLFDNSMIDRDGSTMIEGKSYLTFYAYDTKCNLVATSDQMYLGMPGSSIKSLLLLLPDESINMQYALFDISGFPGVFRKNTIVSSVKVIFHGRFMYRDKDSTIFEGDSESNRAEVINNVEILPPNVTMPYYSN